MTLRGGRWDLIKKKESGEKNDRPHGKGVEDKRQGGCVYVGASRSGRLDK